MQGQQRKFIPGGGSEPPGPGVNAAGLALYQYKTRCGTMYGHSGNTFGFTQYAAASPDGRRSMTISINLQRTHENEGQAGEVFKAFQKAALLAVCAALNLGVTVKDGIAVLWGPVPSVELSFPAEARLRALIELIDVRNRLEIEPDGWGPLWHLAPPRILPERLPPPLPGVRPPLGVPWREPEREVRSV